MQYYPHRQNKHGLFISILLYILAGVCFFGSGQAVPYPGLWQIVGMGFAVTAILVTGRYSLSNYLYILTPPDLLDRKNQLTVVRVLGQKRETVAKIELNTVTAVLRASEWKAKARQMEKKLTQRGDFCVDLFPAQSYILVAEGKDRIVIALQCDEAFITELKSRIYLQD